MGGLGVFAPLRGCGRDATATFRLPGGGALRCRCAAGALDRMRGLLGTSPGDPECNAVLLLPCSSVHTFGMAYPLDLAFFGRDGTVLAAFRAVAPGRVRSHPGAVAVLEREAAPGPWPEPGDAVLPAGARRRRRVRA